MDVRGPGRLQLRGPGRLHLVTPEHHLGSLSEQRLDLCPPTTTTSNEFTENHKSTRRSLYIIMTTLWLLPADKS